MHRGRAPPPSRLWFRTSPCATTRVDDQSDAHAWPGSLTATLEQPVNEHILSAPRMDQPNPA